MAALEALGTPVHVQDYELLTDATQDECNRFLSTLSELGHSRNIRLESLQGHTLETLLAKRGVTIDAIAVHSDGSVVDPFEGRAHLSAEQIRTVQAPDHAFRKQPILLLKIADIISNTGFRASSELRRYATRDSGNVLDIEDRGSQWGTQINALLMGNAIEPALQWLQDTRVLGFIMPEVAAMIGFEKSCSVHHKDIWDHTKLVTQKAARNLVVRWAALCHDVGKVWTRTVTRGGKVHFFRHEEHGAMLFESIAFRFALDSLLSERVAYVIRHHSRVNLYRPDWSDSAVRRLIRENEGHLEELLTFSKADFTTKRQDRIAELQHQIGHLESRIVQIKADDSKVPPLPSGLGVAIMERFDLPPSPLIGELKQRLETAVEAGKLPVQGDNGIYLGWLKEDPQSLDRITSARGQVG
jgi:poly(A) polymerase